MGDTPTHSPAENNSQTAPEAVKAPAAATDFTAMEAKKKEDADQLKKNEAQDTALHNPDKALEPLKDIDESQKKPETPANPAPEVVPDANAKLFTKSRWSAVALDLARGLAIDSKNPEQGFFQGLFNSLKLTGLKMLTWISGKGWYKELSDEDKQLLDANYGIKATGDGSIFTWGETESAAAPDQNTPATEPEKKPDLSDEQKKEMTGKALADILTNEKLIGTTDLVKSPKNCRFTLPSVVDNQLNQEDEVRITRNGIQVGALTYLVDQMSQYPIDSVTFAQKDGKIQGSARVSVDGATGTVNNLIKVLEDIRSGKKDKIELTLDNGKKVSFKRVDKIPEAAVAEKPEDPLKKAYEDVAGGLKEQSADLTSEGSKFDFKVPFLKDEKIENADATLTKNTLKVGDKQFSIKLPGDSHFEHISIAADHVSFTVKTPIGTKINDLPFDKFSALLEELRTADKNVDTFDGDGNKITFELQQKTV